MIRNWLICVAFGLGIVGAYARTLGRTPDDVSICLPWYVVNHFKSIVHWEDGRETVDFPAMPVMEEKAGWMLALPCAATEVRIEWGAPLDLPDGRLPKSAIHQRLEDMTLAASATQIYPAVYDLFLRGNAYAESGGSRAREERCGLRFKVVEAKDENELAEKSREAEISFSEKAIAQMGRFADGKHCFLMISVVSPEEYGKPMEGRVLWYEKAPWLHVTFSAARCVLPARVGTVPSTCEAYAWIRGFVVPEGYGGTTIRCTRYLAVEERWGDGAEPYTATGGECDGREIYFDSDPAMSDVKGWLRLFSAWPTFVLLTLAWVVVCSYVSGGIAGLATTLRWGGPARLGIWNLMTVLGLVVAVWRTKLLRGKWRKWAYVGIFSVVFMGMNVGAQCGLDQAMGGYTRFRYFGCYGW